MGQDTGHGAQRGAAHTATATQAAAENRQVAVTANRLDARDLFVATREISIVHGAETYRLRLTSQNKLILTK